MKVRIQLKQINLLENEEKIIADGNAILENNHLKYKEKDENALHFVTFEEDEVTLERKCDISSTTVLKNGKFGHSTIKSPYGDMEMKTKTHKVVKSESLWAVEYSVICKNEEILRQRLEWNIQYLS